MYNFDSVLVQPQLDDITTKTISEHLDVAGALDLHSMLLTMEQCLSKIFSWSKTIRCIL